MVRIGHMRMRMPPRLVAMAMAVRAGRHRIMHMVVVAIVMQVRMFVLHHVVPMLVAVRLRQVQHHAGQHQRAAPAISQLIDWSPNATATAAPMKGANAKTEPVRAAPNARCANR